MPQLSPLLWLNIFIFMVLVFMVMLSGSYFSMSTVEVKFRYEARVIAYPLTLEKCMFGL
uniref:ATP synthase complex subunit 8 n=1 Tax=Pthirus pubis TaxID=121228 RepID=C0ILU8_PTHPU|nr:ATP synthase subunit 8 [Pthirus pubis]